MCWAWITTATPRAPVLPLDRLGDTAGSVPPWICWAAGVHVDDPRDLLTVPEHLAVQDIGHVGLADEGQQVVLAERVQLDVPTNTISLLSGAEQGNR